MATLKFKDTSSCQRQDQLVVPIEDYLYAKFEADVRANVTSKSKINLALFGTGRAGTIHLQTIARHPRVRLLYIVEDIVEKHEAIKQYWGLDDTIFLTSKDADRVYNDNKVTAVIVASPTFTHEEIVKSSLNAKKAVFCEKPIAQDIEVTAQCFKQAEENGKPLFCAFNRRFDPSYAHVRERVHNGEVGHVQLIKVTSKDCPMAPVEYLKISGGIFHDSLVHDIDMVCWVLGEYPCRVTTTAVANLEEIAAINDYDTVVINFLFPSGTIGIIDISRTCNYGYDQRLEVFGPRGMIRANNETPLHGITRQNNTESIKSPPIWYSFPSRYKNAYQNEMEHFLKVVQGEEKSKVHGLEILTVTKIATAAEQSARTGKSVELTWDPLEDFTLHIN